MCWFSHTIVCGTRYMNEYFTIHPEIVIKIATHGNTSRGIEIARDYERRCLDLTRKRRVPSP